ncbi:F-box protein SKIP8 [Platanthera guangdongensis]|uniref:F-box protein SKIP8 n=1 Tax=Platanthera guangdongensis TaxID=2320717 RepID=A0ABR2LDB7_9ASPA
MTEAKSLEDVDALDRGENNQEVGFSCFHGDCDGVGNSGREISAAPQNRDSAGKDKATAAAAERQSSASMMEQLIPEITTHTLNYLDYTSLCNLSMTTAMATE